MVGVLACENKEVLEGKVVEVVRGGVIVLVGPNRVFVPASQATLKKDEELEPLKNTEVKFRIIEVDEANGRRKRVIGSIRSVLREERQAEVENFWTSLEEGKKFDGVVKSLTAFGAFVDIGGVDGMIHISEVAANYVKDIREHLTVGQEVKTKVISVTPDGKISLSIRKLLEQPKEQRPQKPQKPRGERRPPVWNGQKSNAPAEGEKQSFEDMMARFKAISDEKMTDLKRASDSKRGSAGYSRRGAK